MRAYVLFGDRLYNFPFQLTNITSPEVRRKEPFAEEGKFFVESEILHRDVNIIPDSCSHVRLDCRVETPKGDLGEVLLYNGFARLIGLPDSEKTEPQYTSVLSQFAQARRTGQTAFRTSPLSILPEAVLKRYKQAQEAAQIKRMRLWQNYVEPTEEEEEEKVPEFDPIIRSYYGIVTEVVSGDTLVVAPINMDVKFLMGGRQWDWKAVLSELDMLPKQGTQEKDDDDDEEETKKGRKMTEEQKRALARRRAADRERRQQVRRMKLFTDGTSLLKLENVLMPEQRINLASITAPRLSLRPPRNVSVAVPEPAAEGSSGPRALRTAQYSNSNPPQPPYAFEAREFLRSMVIGKIVAVNVEYRRAPPPNVRGPGAGGAREREYSTVMYNGENLGEVMVREGFARPIRHRDDEPRSRYYTAIERAEADAIKHHRRLYQFEHELIQQQMEITRQEQEEELRIRVSRKPRSRMTPAEQDEVQRERAQRNATERSRREAVRLTLNRKLADAAPAVRINDISGDARVNRQMLGLLTGGTTAQSVLAASSELFTAPPYIPGTAAKQIALINASRKPIRVRSDEDWFDAVVEQVLSPIRMKILIPKHHLVLMFELDGLDAPRGAPPHIYVDPIKDLASIDVEERKRIQGLEPADRFSETSTAAARHLLLNKNVRIGLSRLNPSGRCWIGSMTVDGVDVSSIMVASGLARIPDEVYDQLVKDAEKADEGKEKTRSHIAEGSVLDLQMKAKERALGIWQLLRSPDDAIAGKTHYSTKDDEEKTREEEEEDEDECEEVYEDDDFESSDVYGIQAMLRASTRRYLSDGLPCRLLDVVDCGALLLQVGNPPTAELTRFYDNLLTYPPSDPRRRDFTIEPPTPSRLPAHGSDVALRVGFTDGLHPLTPADLTDRSVTKEWHRAVVETATKDEVEFTLIDTQVPITYPLSMLPSVMMALDENVAIQPACAFYAFVAYVTPIIDPTLKDRDQVSTDPFYTQLQNEGINTIHSLCRDGQLYCYREWVDKDHRPSVTIVRVQKEKKRGRGKAAEDGDETYTIINLEIARHGYVVVDTKNIPQSHKKYMGLYLDAVESARAAHAGGWERGDFRSADLADEEKSLQDQWKATQRAKVAAMAKKRHIKLEAEMYSDVVELKQEIDVEAEHKREAEERAAKERAAKEEAARVAQEKRQKAAEKKAQMAKEMAKAVEEEKKAAEKPAPASSSSSEDGEEEESEESEEEGKPEGAQTGAPAQKQSPKNQRRRKKGKKPNSRKRRR